MKALSLLLLAVLSSTLYGQTKFSYSKITEITGTDYVIANTDSWSKGKGGENRQWLFINTKTGETNEFALPEGGWFNGRPEQVKIDELGIHILLVSAQTTDLDGKNEIDYSDPMQLIALSVDGKKSKPACDNNFYVRAWTVNRKTGTVVITGYYDTNNNRKYDQTDKNEIQIFDLKTLTVTKRI